VLGQQRDVVGPVPQRREGEGDHGQPMVEVFPEVAGLDGVPEIGVGRRHDADVDWLAAGSAESANRALLDCGQELGLDGECQEPDLVDLCGAQHKSTRWGI